MQNGSALLRRKVNHPKLLLSIVVVAAISSAYRRPLHQTYIINQVMTLFNSNRTGIHGYLVLLPLIAVDKASVLGFDYSLILLWSLLRLHPS